MKCCEKTSPNRIIVVLSKNGLDLAVAGRALKKRLSDLTSTGAGGEWGDPKRVKMERRCVRGSDRPREPRGVAAFLRTPALRPRRGFLAHCADPMYLWDVYPVTRRIGERAPR